MYNRLYFYAVGQDYLDLIEQILYYDMYALPTHEIGNNDLLPDYEPIDRGRFLSLKKRKDIRIPRKSNMLFSEATYDVVSWARGYIYKDRQLVGHMIQQTLPRFKKPNPTELDLE